MDEHQIILALIQSFLKESGMAETTFGAKAVNDGKFVSRIQSGGGMTLKTAEKIREFIRNYHVGRAAA